jgi:hypothetical protein
MHIISNERSGSAALLRELAEASEVLRASNFVLRWGVPGQGFGGSAGWNAVEQLTRMQAAGVSVPEFSLVRPAPPQGWWGRRLIHTRGLDIRDPVRQPRGFRESEFWVRVVPSESEFRIHIFEGRSISRAQKVPGSTLDASLPPVRSQLVRNRRTGWRLRHQCTLLPGVREAAKAAVAALGYDFGAVDILVRPDGTPCVLEVNRAPGLDETTASAYITALERKVKG